MHEPRPVPMNRRELLLAGASCTTLLALPARAWSSPGFDIVADPSGRDGALPSLSAALDCVRKLGRPGRILVRGRHAEKLHVDIAGLTLVGAPGATIVLARRGAVDDRRARRADQSQPGNVDMELFRMAAADEDPARAAELARSVERG